jgi:hypothetical protein
MSAVINPADKYLMFVIPANAGHAVKLWRYPVVVLDSGSQEPVLDSDPGSGMTDFDYLIAGLI